MKPTEKGPGSKGKKSKQVNVFGEQEDIGGLSNALCTASFNVMSDEVENEWTEVKRGRIL